MPDVQGSIGAVTTVVINAFDPRSGNSVDWQAIAIAYGAHKNLLYHSLYFHRTGAFNVGWREETERKIDNYVGPRGNCRIPEDLEDCREPK